MQLKGKQAESFANRPKPDIWAVVTHSTDEGQSNDTAVALLKAWRPKSGDLDITVLDDDSLKSDPSRLFDTLEAVSLLGGERAVRVRTSGDKSAKLLIAAIQAGDETPGRFAAKLVIQAGALQKKSKLRAAAEAATHTACLQLFADDLTDLEGLTKDKLLEDGATIDAGALSLFITNLPGHRSIANTEIEKLCLYARGLGRPITTSDIRQLTATDVDHALSVAVQAALNGQPERAHAEIQRLAIAGTTGISFVRALQMEGLRMLDAHSKIASGAANPGMKLRPPVWQSDWPAFRQRLQLWPQKRLLRLMERLYETERQAKSGGASADAAARILMNDLARAAEHAAAARA